MIAKSFTHLIAWQKGHSLVIHIYRITKEFPKEETYSLTDQIRRAAISITSNLAEGFSRQSQKEKIQFYFVALGSLNEVQNQLLIAKDIGYLTPKEFESVVSSSIEVSKLINGLIKSIKR